MAEGFCLYSYENHVPGCLGWNWVSTSPRMWRSWLFLPSLWVDLGTELNWKECRHLWPLCDRLVGLPIGGNFVEAPLRKMLIWSYAESIQVHILGNRLLEGCFRHVVSTSTPWTFIPVLGPLWYLWNPGRRRLWWNTQTKRIEVRATPRRDFPLRVVGFIPGERWTLTRKVRVGSLVLLWSNRGQAAGSGQGSVRWMVFQSYLWPTFEQSRSCPCPSPGGRASVGTTQPESWREAQKTVGGVSSAWRRFISTMEQNDGKDLLWVGHAYPWELYY